MLKRVQLLLSLFFLISSLSFAGQNITGKLYVSGNTGLGTSIPATLLSVGTSSSGGSITKNGFNVDSTGNITNLGGVQCNINAATVDLTNAGASIKFGNNSGSAGSNVDIHTNNSTGYIKIDPANDSEAMRVNYDGNVGIGSSIPGYKLDVNGDIQADSVHFPNPTGGITAQDSIIFDPDGSGTLMTLSTARNVGISSTNPGALLDVQGTIRTTGFILSTNPVAGYVLTSNAIGLGTWTPGGGGGGGVSSQWIESPGNVGIYTVQPVGIGTISPIATLQIVGTGNVGINTLNPGQQLDVRGTIRTTGFTLNLNPNSGYVLTSNSVGVGTWMPASSGGGGGSSFWQESAGNVGINTTQNVGIGTGSAVVGGTSQLMVQGNSSNDVSSLGGEDFAAATWTSTGWTGGWVAGWSHTSGNTNNLVFLSGSDYTGAVWKFTRTVTSAGAGNDGCFEVTVGGITLPSAGGYDCGNGTLTYYFTGLSNANFTIIPYQSTTVGVFALSLKPVAQSTPIIELLSSNGSDALEIRGEHHSGDPTKSNTFVGVGAGGNNLSGDRNTAFGYNALTSTITASNNIAIGNEALKNNLTGNDNFAIGYQALKSLDHGADNTALGYQALKSATVLSGSTAIGSLALSSNLTGSFNTAVGYDSLAANTSVFNTAVGYESGSNVTTGNNNVYIGFNVQGSGTGASNEIVIGSGGGGYGNGTTAIGNGSTVATIFPVGNVGIGSATPGTALDVIGNMRMIGTGAGAFRVQAAGNQACTTTCTTGKALFGFDDGTLGVALPHLVSPTDATADECLCGS